jgi:energy-coupling factor transporter ATPase
MNKVLHPLEKVQKFLEEKFLKQKVIEVSGLQYEYQISKLNKIRALEDINIEFEEGEFVAIIGQNGSGKTTLAKHFNGLLKPTKGDVFVYGNNTRTKTVAELSNRVGFVFQNPDQQIFAETVKEEVAFGLKNLGFSDKEVNESTEKALTIVGLQDLSAESPFSLSKGQRQGLAVASVIAMNPDVIVLDEPTTGRDYLESKRIMDLAQEMNQKGKTVIFITHNMQLVAEYARRIIVMLRGQILLDDGPKLVFEKTEELARTYLQAPQITRISLELLNGHVACTTEEFLSQFLLQHFYTANNSYLRDEVDA